MGLPVIILLGQGGVVGRAYEAGALTDPVEQELLALLLVGGLLGHLPGQVALDDDYGFGVPDKDVATVDGEAAAADRGLVEDGGSRSRARARMAGRAGAR